MKKVGNYLLVQKLGEGQFGIVYKAKHTETDETYAIKTIEKKKVNMNPKLRKLFDTEMHVMKTIHHPNILHLFEYLETANNYYLVINYCNGGDLEEHVKKNGNLGQEESVYFLMQIMNGFKELHKHKIMHRDFKLANIFLHDDSIIIGDFGFAKSGVDMTTTKLGSPITMAPELLNAQGACRYTNKADLWSIGVCFFQMIFGKVPWDAKNMADLQTKVRTQSGSNLNIPASPPTTQECKSLLRALLQSDPNRRLEWKDFFNHKLFDITPDPQVMPVADMKQSVMFRNNEDKVKKMFNNNKQKQEAGEVDLVEPEDLQIDEKNAYHEEVNLKQQELERVIEQAKMRFTHEKKVIVFIMHTCRKLRIISKKEAEIGKAANGFMFSAVLLMRKGILLNEATLNVINSKTNTFGINKFPEFLGSQVCSKMYQELLKDNSIYMNLQNHLQAKLKEEVTLASVPAQEVYRLSTDAKATFKEVQDRLKQETYWLMDFYMGSKHKFEPELQKELSISLAHLYVATYCDSELAYKSPENIVFDWVTFERQLNLAFVTNKIKSACTALNINPPA